MGIFGKKKEDVIDFTKMYGGSKKPVPSYKGDSDFIDLKPKSEVKKEIGSVYPNPGKTYGYGGRTESISSSFSQTSSSPSTSFFDLGASEVKYPQVASTPSPGPITDALREKRQETLKGKFNEIHLKIDDLEYKMNNILEKLREIERRLG